MQGTDTHNWIISLKTTEPKAGTFWKRIAYYTTIESAVNGLIVGITYNKEGAAEKLPPINLDE